MESSYWLTKSFLVCPYLIALFKAYLQVLNLLSNDV
jgi:hypothetical protein